MAAAQRSRGMVGVQDVDAFLGVRGNVEDVDAEIVRRKVEKAGVRFSDAADRQRFAEIEHAHQLALRQFNLVNLAVISR